MNGMENKLTIAIPTYNRKDDLINLLKSIEALDYSVLYEIIISDNNSPYDIYEILKGEVCRSLFNKCRIIKNHVNIGGPGNIKNQLLYCKSKWLWMIGDDDVVLPNSLDIIINDINTDPNCAFFRYSISIKGKDEEEDIDVIEDNTTMYSLYDFIHYYENPNRHKGNMVFMSNNIYNMEKLSPYLSYAFTYNTSITQLIPSFIGLDKKEIYIRYRNKKIVQFNGQDTGTSWSYIRVFCAMSTVKQIPFESLDRKGIEQLMRVLIFIPLHGFMIWCLVNKDKIKRIDMIEYVYKNLYSYKFSLIEYIFYLLSLIELKWGIKLIPRRIIKNRIHML